MNHIRFDTGVQLLAGTVRGCVLLLLCLLTSISLVARASGDSDDLFGLSIDELMDVEIVSSSRQVQSLQESSIPVSVITAEDIHYSGLTTLPEILQLAPGVDVRRLDRYRYIVGVRGMASSVSDRTLVLINGRTAMNSVFGPPDWLNLPVLIEDIERIEILRGPIGSAWGANAETGIINIITKKAGAETGSLLSTTISEYGDVYNHLRFSGAKNDWSWRVSAGYEDIRNSDAAGAGQTESAFNDPGLQALMGFNTYTARDSARISRFDSEFRRQISPETVLLFGAAYSYAEAGDTEFVGFYPFRDNRTNTTRLFARLEHTFDNSTTGYVQWYGNFIDAVAPQMTNHYAYYENDLEAQINVESSESHSSSLGGNVRWTRMHYDSDPRDAITFTDSRFDEYQAGLFAIDRVKLSDKLSFETQARVDYFSETQTDWSLRATTLYSLDDEENHVLRASVARSFRSANLSLRESRSSTVMGLFNVIAPPRPLEDETTYAIEAGYTGILDDSLIVRMNSYYQRIEDILGVRSVVDGFGITRSTAENLQGADTYGAECEITYHQDRFEITGWYAYNKFRLDPAGQTIRADIPAEHKVGLRTRFHLDDHWIFNADYTYNDSIPDTSFGLPMNSSGVFHRLDLTLSHPFKNNRGEIMVGVSDVLNDTQPVNYDVTTFTAYETPGRTFFARLQLYF